jgi:histidine triad (HIT) family protein
MVEQHTLAPEEMAGDAKQQCIFCHIAAGRVASRKVYEDDKVVAVLDINPGNPGHVLLIPKEHFVIMPQIPEDILQHMGMVAKGISHAQLRALKAQGTNIFVANGVAAGQRAQHFMMHVIPRTEKDAVGLVLPARSMRPEDEQQAHKLLKKALSKALGLKVPDEEESRKDEQVPHAEKKEKDLKKETAEKKAPEKQEDAAAEKEKEKKTDSEEKTPAKKPAGANLDDIAKLLTGGK